MKRQLTTIIATLLLQLTSFGQQSDSLFVHEKRIAQLEQQLTQQQRQTAALQRIVATLEQQLHNLGNHLSATDTAIATIDSNYEQRFAQTDSTMQSNEDKRQRSVLWGIAIAAVLAVASMLIYLLLRKRINRKGDDIELLRARADDLNRQMVEHMDKELEELQKIATVATQVPPAQAEPDHSLAIPIADAIARIENNIYVMDSKTRGLKQIVRALDKMRDNLKAGGYEVVKMLGEPYNDNMVLKTVAFQPNPDLAEGERIITTINKPQINYNGNTIQYADIVVSTN